MKHRVEYGPRFILAFLFNYIYFGGKFEQWFGFLMCVPKAQ